MPCRRSSRSPVRPFLALALLGGAFTGLPRAGAAPPTASDAALWRQAEAELAAYRAELDELRRGRRTRYALPAVDFFQFGMGARRKLLFVGGELRDARSGELLGRYPARDPKRDLLIVPSAYRVLVRTPRGLVRIVEDEDGVTIHEGQRARRLPGAPLALPDFAGHRFARVLRVLHHEIAINVVDGKPLPNFLVYDRPWYRDAAMMAMVLERTGNLALIADWVRGLDAPFDRNNAGEEEADNPGQALYLLSRAADASHPLVPALLQALRRFEVAGGTHVDGRSDFARHPVYQTQWAKFGLRALGLPDPYQVPPLDDSYALLFWWDDALKYTPKARFGCTDTVDYPYLKWAEDHHQGSHDGPLGDRDYPLSWEANASQARYAAMAAVAPAFVERKLAAPHTWHAAEMFLLLHGQPVPVAGGER